jgi:hypothetical protein
MLQRTRRKQAADAAPNASHSQHSEEKTKTKGSARRALSRLGEAALGRREPSGSEETGEAGRTRSRRTRLEEFGQKLTQAPSRPFASKTKDASGPEETGQAGSTRSRRSRLEEFGQKLTQPPSRPFASKTRGAASSSAGEPAALADPARARTRSADHLAHMGATRTPAQFKVDLKSYTPEFNALAAPYLKAQEFASGKSYAELHAHFEGLPPSEQQFHSAPLIERFSQEYTPDTLLAYSKEAHSAEEMAVYKPYLDAQRFAGKITKKALVKYIKNSPEPERAIFMPILAQRYATELSAEDLRSHVSGLRDASTTKKYFAPYMREQEAAKNMSDAEVNQHFESMPEHGKSAFLGVWAERQVQKRSLSELKTFVATQPKAYQVAFRPYIEALEKAAPAKPGAAPVQTAATPTEPAQGQEETVSSPKSQPPTPPAAVVTPPSPEISAFASAAPITRGGSLSNQVSSTTPEGTRPAVAATPSPALSNAAARRLQPSPLPEPFSPLNDLTSPVTSEAGDSASISSSPPGSVDGSTDFDEQSADIVIEPKRITELGLTQNEFS